MHDKEVTVDCSPARLVLGAVTKKQVHIGGLLIGSPILVPHTKSNTMYKDMMYMVHIYQIQMNAPEGLK